MSQVSSNASLSELRGRVVAKGNVSATGCYVSHARGATVVDVEGREYIDFAGGIAVMNVGHSHPKVVEAIRKQAEKFTHTCFMVVPYESAVRLAEKLCALVPGDFPKAAMFANSGAEAVENAVKIARYYTQKPAVIAFENGFHGRTFMGMSLTSKIKPYKLGFGPFMPEVYRMPFAYCYRCPFKLDYPRCEIACAEYLNDFLLSHVAPEDTAAVIAEPVQGEGGFIVPPKEYFPRIKEICEANGILFIADEIQSAIGRTGAMFAMEHFGVAADITTSAKSLAAGMPISAVVGKKEIMDAVHASGIGGTYGGNPVACEAALAVLDIFETEDLIEKAKTLGGHLNTHLQRFKDQFELVGDVRGIGPMMALELVKDREKKTPAADEAKALVKFCFDRGLIILSCGAHGNVIRLMMPLVTPEEQLFKGLEIIGEGLEAVGKEASQVMNVIN
jgi:4-aminobutyrate aminotransferase/(S)-3-amino-2-methylpropionate transaminase